MILKCKGFAFFVAQMTCVVISDPAPASSCPPVAAWSRSFQTQVANELQEAPSSALAQVYLQHVQHRRIAKARGSAKRRR
jgi:hypothetical protein